MKMATPDHPMSPDQQHALAMLVHRLRPRWDIPGIQSAISTAGAMTVDPFDLARAAIAAAENPRNRTPAVIALPGEHWHVRAKVTPTPPRRVPCDTHGLPGTDLHCAECIAALPTPDEIARIRAEGRKR